jgi:hypothetical protein
VASRVVLSSIELVSYLVICLHADNCKASWDYRMLVKQFINVTKTLTGEKPWIFSSYILNLFGNILVRVPPFDELFHWRATVKFFFYQSKNYLHNIRLVLHFLLDKSPFDCSWWNRFVFVLTKTPWKSCKQTTRWKRIVEYATLGVCFRDSWFSAEHDIVSTVVRGQPRDREGQSDNMTGCNIESRLHEMYRLVSWHTLHNITVLQFAR